MRSANADRSRQPGRSRHPSPQIIFVRRGKARSFVIRPWLVGAFGGLSLLFLTAYVGGTAYLFFREDIVEAAEVSQAELRQGYEDRIAALRSEVDRLASRNLVNQQALTARLDELLGRQAALGERQQMLTGLDIAAAGAEVELLPDEPPPPPAPRPLPDRAAMDSRPAAKTPGLPGSAGADEVLGQIEDHLGMMERDLAATVDTVTTTISQRTEQIATVLQSLGIDDAPGLDGGVGGPYEPLASDPHDTRNFLTTIAMVSDEIERLTLLRQAADRLPLGRPIENVSVSSGFGPRVDPFVRRRAMHTGIDFRGTQGAAVRATAPGTVVSAGYAGGYGNMIEIDHGEGIATRYGHLSRIEVKVGDVIEPGEVIGRVGSTGRSTGPHLHYELRVNDRAIDPMRFIRAGSELRALL